jgi:hypothetical protein
VCTSHGRDVQRLVARVQDEYLGHGQKNVATRFPERQRLPAGEAGLRRRLGPL